MSRWVKSVVSDLCGDVRFTPESDRSLRCREMTLCAISDQSAAQQNGVLFNHFFGCDEPVAKGHEPTKDP